MARELIIEADTLNKFSPEINYWLGALLVATHHEHKAVKPLTLALDSAFKTNELNYFLALWRKSL